MSEETWKYIVAGGDDQRLTFLAADSFDKLGSIECSGAPTNKIFLMQNKQLIGQLTQGQFHLISLDKKTAVGSYKTVHNLLFDAFELENSSYKSCALVAEEGFLNVLDIRQKGFVFEHRLATYLISAAKIDSSLFLLDHKNLMYHFDFVAGKVVSVLDLAKLVRSAAPANSWRVETTHLAVAAFFPKKSLAFATLQGSLFTLQNEEQIELLYQAHHDKFFCSLHGIDDELFAGLSDNSLLRLNRVSSCKLKGHSGWVWDVVKNGHSLFSCSSDGQICVWENGNEDPSSYLSVSVNRVLSVCCA